MKGASLLLLPGELFLLKPVEAVWVQLPRLPPPPPRMSPITWAPYRAKSVLAEPFFLWHIWRGEISGKD